MLGRLGRAFAIVALFGVSAGSPEVKAAGFGLFEVGTPSGAMAFAGASAGGDGGSVSYSFWNPASLVGPGVDPGGGLRAEAYQALIFPEHEMAIEQTEEYTGRPGADGKSETSVNFAPASAGPDNPAYVPAFFVAYAPPQMSDTAFGLAVTVPFGLSTNYEDDWRGRILGIKSKVAGMNINPMVAHRLSDNISLGVGLQVHRFEGEFTSAPRIYANDPRDSGYGFSEVKGEDWGYGYVVGVLLSPSENFRLGASYRSAVRHKLEGRMRSRVPNVPLDRSDPTDRGHLLGQETLRGMDGKAVEADVKLPDYVMLGGWYQANDRWGFGIQGVRMRWSNIKDLTIKRKEAQSVLGVSHPAGSAVTIEEYNWRDTWLVSVGGAYKYDNLTLRAGWAYDQSPVNASNRSVRVPDSGRQWFAFGGDYRFDNSIRLDIHYAYLRFSDGRIDRSLKKYDLTDAEQRAEFFKGASGSQGLRAKVETVAHIVSLQLGSSW